AAAGGAPPTPPPLAPPASAAACAPAPARPRLAAHPLDRQVRDLGLPTLVLHGRDDRFYDWEPTSDRYQRVGAQVEIIDGAGHSPAIECPARVAESIHRFHQGRDFPVRPAIGQGRPE
uniref:alpha/beta fold hydrolase n=1 Tax=Nocardia farcinica TaxID=37329 RepID=UPI00245374FA